MGKSTYPLDEVGSVQFFICGTERKERIFVVRSNIKRDSAKEVETKLSHLRLRTNHLLSTIVTTSHRKKEDINS